LRRVRFCLSYGGPFGSRETDHSMAGNFRHNFLEGRLRRWGQPTPAQISCGVAHFAMHHAGVAGGFLQSLSMRAAMP
jgi:hypothetical protein